MGWIFPCLHGAGVTGAMAEPIGPARQPRVVTTVRLSEAAWRWLRKCARDEAERSGGRPDASAVLERLIRRMAAADST